VDPADRLVYVSVHGYQIQISIQVDIEESAAESQAGPGRLAHARPLRDVPVDAFTRGAKERRHFVVEVGDGDAFHAGVVEIGGVHAHAGARLAVLAECHAGAYRDILEGSVAQVAVQLVGLRIVGDHQVGPAVAVVVEQRHTQRFGGAVEDPAPRRDIFKGAVPAVPEEPAGFAVIGFRRAVRLALAVHTAEDVVRRRPLDVVADQQIQPTVAVEVKPHGGRAESVAAPQAGLFGDVDETPAPVVLEEAALSHCRDQKIGKAVVVIIPDGYAHPVHLHCQAGALGDIGEGAVTVVAV
jgi:hypothetical protein